MTPLDIAGLFRDYGPWGLLALAAAVIAALYRDLKQLNATILSDRERLITAQHATAAASEKLASAIDGVKATLSAHKDANESLTRQVELAAQETRHTLANVRSALDAMASRLNRADGPRGRS